MNILQAQHFFRTAWRLAAALALVFTVSGAGAQPAQPARFLLIFETSPAIKKNLPMIQQTLNKLFAANLQNEIQSEDDLAVWTVDQTLHTGTFPLANWSAEDAEMYSQRLYDFLGREKYSRHASLAAIQPLLNRVAKNSDRLTVVIFCDSQSQLLGTPYDSGMNEIITNAAVKAKNVQFPFILVLRAYHGEYIGGSVNRSAPLNFPKFPAPPPPEPPPVVKAVVPVPAFVAPVMPPVPALIIVGTNASTNVSALLKPPVAQAPAPPAVVVPATVVPPVPLPAPATTPPQKTVVVPPPNVAPVVAVVTPSPASSPSPKNMEPAVVAPPDAIVSTNPPVEPPTNAVAVTAEHPPADSGYVPTLAIAGGGLAVALVIIGWVLLRGRRPRSSLITSSMQDDPRLPPRK